MKTSFAFLSSLSLVLLLACARAEAQDPKGYLGAYLGSVPTEASGTDTAPGAWVARVVPGGPGEKAGLQAKDIVLRAGDEEIRTPEQLRALISGRKPGDTIEMKVRRGEETVDCRVVLGEAPHAADPTRAPAQDDPRDAAHRAFLGVGFGPVPGPIAYHLGIGEEVGVLVGDVWKDSPAEKAELRTNDVIVSVDGKEVRGPDSFVEALANRKPGDKIALGLIQKGTRKDLELTLAERPREIPGLGFDPRTPGSPWGRTFVPEQGQRGRVIVRRPDGTDQSFDFPGGSFDMDGFFEKLEAEFPEIGDHGNMTERMRGLFDSLRAPGSPQAWSSRNSVVRMVEEGFDVTVSESNGSRTATVKQGEKTIAENLPQDQWKTLPEDVLRRVEKAAKSIDPLSSPPVKIERKSSEAEKADDSLKA